MRDRSETVSKTVFIVGVPRSGTTWTMMLLNQHPQIAVLQQSGLLHVLQPLDKWWRSVGGYGKRVVSSPRPADDASADPSGPRELFVGDLLDKDDLDAFCAPILQYVYARIREAASSSVVVDQTPENIEFAEWILRMMPDAYFLHIVRDPRAVYASMRAANTSWARNAFPHHPESVGDMWRTYAEKVRDLKERTDRIIEVRYEDLLDDGKAQLSRILSWLKLDFDDSDVEQALQNCRIEKLRQASVAPPTFLRRGTAEGWQNEVSRRQAACVEYGAYPFMEAYGYSLTSPRPERAPVAVRIRGAIKRVLLPALEAVRPAFKRVTKIVGG